MAAIKDPWSKKSAIASHEILFFLEQYDMCENKRRRKYEFSEVSVGVTKMRYITTGVQCLRGWCDREVENKNIW